MSNEGSSVPKYHRMTEAEGFALVRNWRASGMSAHKYCRVHGLGVHRIHYWNQRLQAQQRMEETGPFRPFIVVASQPEEAVEEQVEAKEESIEVQVGEISIRTSIQSLPRVLRTLKELP